MSALADTLKARLFALAAPDRALDAAILEFCGLTVMYREHKGDYRFQLAGSDQWMDAPRLTSSVSACRALIELMLPHFGVKSGVKWSSAQASLWPDYDAPVDGQFREFWPEAECFAGWATRILPGGGTHRECAALLICAISALDERRVPVEEGPRIVERPL